MNREKHGPVRDYEVLLRKRLNQRFPDMAFFFEPANITNQILNFGLPAPIDLQVVGRDTVNNYKIAQRLRDRIARIPGAADVHIHQVFSQPQLNLNVDRVKAGQLGLTQRDVTEQHADFAQRQQSGGSQLLAEPGQRRQLQRRRADLAVSHRFAGRIAADAHHRGDQRGQHEHSRLACRRLTNGNASVGSVAQRRDRRRTEIPERSPTERSFSPIWWTCERSYGPVIINHYNVAPVFDVYANVDRRDLGSVGSEVETNHAGTSRGHLPRGTTLDAARRVRNHADTRSSGSAWEWSSRSCWCIS